MPVSGPTAHDDDLVHPAELYERGDILGLMRACHDRRLEREGIPMVLGLADERGAIPASSNADQLAEGATFAETFDRYSAALVPWAREDDEDAVIEAMQVLGYTHFAPGATPLRAPEPAFDASTTVAPHPDAPNAADVDRTAGL